MDRRTFLVATVNAQLRAQTAIKRFEKEFGNGNQNQRGNSPQNGQTNNAAGNVPQQPAQKQPVYGG